MCLEHLVLGRRLGELLVRCAEGLAQQRHVCAQPRLRAAAAAADVVRSDARRREYAEYRRRQPVARSRQRLADGNRQSDISRSASHSGAAALGAAGQAEPLTSGMLHVKCTLR